MTVGDRRHTWRPRESVRRRRPGTPLHGWRTALVALAVIVGVVTIPIHWIVLMYAFLLGAIAAEVTGTLATRQSDGFTRLVPSVVAITGVVGAYYLFSLTLRNGMNIGAAYATWAALGVAAVAILGALFFGDTLTLVQVLGIALVMGGVLTLELGGTG